MLEVFGPGPGGLLCSSSSVAGPLGSSSSRSSSVLPVSASWSAATCAIGRTSCESPLQPCRPPSSGSSGSSSPFGLALAVGRYESRRAAVVEEANTIGTTYLRAQTLAEPYRTASLERLVRYTDTSIRLSRSVPNSSTANEAVADGQELQRELWSLAGESLDSAPTASAPRLYVETLNEMIDMQTVRVSALNNRVPPAVLWLEIAGAAVALGLLAAYLAILGRGVVAVLLAAGLVTLLLLVTFDLDRPTRGLIRVPATPLTDLRDSMDLPPAFTRSK